MKKIGMRIAGSIVFLAAALYIERALSYPIAALACFVIAYIVIGGDILVKAVRGIGRGQVFDENFLMALATIGAFVVGEYPEAVSVMLFYQVGEAFNDYAVGKSRNSISALMELNPETACVLRNGEEEIVDPYEVEIGDTIVVKPGERIPLDGVVLEGGGSLDTSALTGESVPRDVAEGDEVVSGCINQNSLLKITVTKRFEDSAVSKILEMVESAGNRKARVENFISKFAKYYTPIVVALALALAIVPNVLRVAFGMFSEVPMGDWFYRACSFLVVSCPCALVISVPLSFFGGIGAASKKGILIKGSNYLEALSKVETAVFDKTGTLTTGVFGVSQVHPKADRPLLELAACAESHSNHPISLSIQAAYGKEIPSDRLGETEETAGFGLCTVVDGEPVYAGNYRWMEKCGVSDPMMEEAKEAAGTVIHVAKGREYQGYLVISDQLKPDAKEAMSALREKGVRKLVMLTGDKDNVGRKVAGELKLDQVYTELLPGDKVEKVEDLLKEKGDGLLLFAGDGINDAPVLAIADVGAAMGGIGSDAAIEAADVVIMDDKPSRLADAIAISRKTMRIVKQNITFALAVKILVLVLAGIGRASMWAAVFGDVGVSILAVLNAMRALRA